MFSKNDQSSLENRVKVVDTPKKQNLIAKPMPKVNPYSKAYNQYQSGYNQYQASFNQKAADKAMNLTQNQAQDLTQNETRSPSNKPVSIPMENSAESALKKSSSFLPERSIFSGVFDKQTAKINPYPAEDKEHQSGT